MTSRFGCDINPVPAGAKTRGAYYTDAPIADFLAWWAIRSAGDLVLDPCFGGGVFLRSACKRLRQMGAGPARQVCGVEIDGPVYQQTKESLRDEHLIDWKDVRLADFFSIDPATALRVDAVIGNPPFVRYQCFSGAARALALARSRAAGVPLPELCSSWAPFVVHCIAMLRPGGRLAVVLPMEVGHAKYARPILEHLHRSFGSATFLTFRNKLFPDLSEDTLLLLADAKGAKSSTFLWRDLSDVSMLSTIRERDQWPLSETQPVDGEAIAAGNSRLIEHFIPRKARDLYRALRTSAAVQRLGDLADVGIGYVTGANDFFHLGLEEARRRGLPGDFLKPVVRRGRALSGLRFTTEDWARTSKIQESAYLLHINKNQQIPETVRAYLDSGEARGVPKGYKCRTRSPWFCVPHVYQPDAFLSYMSGAAPRLVANDAGVFAPNSLHVLRLHPLAQVTGAMVAALWQTSLTRLSVEIEGHAMGGGMLKLEPTEAENVLVPCPGKSAYPRLEGLAAEWDQLVRHASAEAAQDRADQVILEEIMGLGRDDCALLRSAAHTLRSRRGYRSPTHELT